MKSEGYQKYLKKIRQNKFLILFSQIFIFLFLIILWQGLVDNNMINSFITSSPKNVLKTIIDLYYNNHLIHHIFVTVYETLLSFSIGTILGILIAILLWYNPFIANVIDPYLTIFNSLPKVSLGPILIIWVGANTKSIIVMSLLISLIITIITVYNGFIATDKNKIKLLKSFQAN
ncbi:MAG: ABC transporter permease subunit, partial [Bacilli bacterium]|nr:ABC transporter permease subunit [Bacilli bacterium]